MIQFIYVHRNEYLLQSIRHATFERFLWAQPNDLYSLHNEIWLINLTSFFRLRYTAQQIQQRMITCPDNVSTPPRVRKGLHRVFQIEGFERIHQKLIYKWHLRNTSLNNLIQFFLSLKLFKLQFFSFLKTIIHSFFIYKDNGRALI